MTEPDLALQGSAILAGDLKLSAIRLPKPMCVIGTIVYDDGSRHEFSALPGDQVTIDLRPDPDDKRVLRYER